MTEENAQASPLLIVDVHEITDIICHLSAKDIRALSCTCKTLHDYIRTLIKEGNPQLLVALLLDDCWMHSWMMPTTARPTLTNSRESNPVKAARLICAALIGDRDREDEDFEYTSIGNFNGIVFEKLHALVQPSPIGLCHPALAEAFAFTKNNAVCLADYLMVNPRYSTDSEYVLQCADKHVLKIVHILRALPGFPMCIECEVSGWPALKYAMQYGYVRTVSALLEAGANIDHVSDKYNKSIMHDMCNEASCALLQQEVRGMNTGAMTRRYALILRMVLRRADMRVRDSSGKTPAQRFVASWDNDEERANAELETFVENNSRVS